MVDTNSDLRRLARASSAISREFASANEATWATPSAFTAHDLHADEIAPVSQRHREQPGLRLRDVAASREEQRQRPARRGRREQRAAGDLSDGGDRGEHVCAGVPEERAARRTAEQLGRELAEPLEQDRRLERGDELAAGAGERGRDAPFALERRLGALALRDVAGDAVHADRAAVVEDDPCAHLELDAVTVLRDDLELVERRRAAGDLARGHLACERQALRRHDLCDVHAQRFLARVARDARRRVVRGAQVALQVVHVDEVVRVVEEVAVALLARAQRRVRDPGLAEEHPREQHANAEQDRRGRHHDPHEDDAQPARAGPERRGEGLPERRQPVVQHVDLAEEASRLLRRRVFPRDRRVQPVADGHQARDVAIRLSPDVHRGRHERDVPEATEELHHDRDVVGMVAALDETRRREAVGGARRALELPARAPVAERHRDRGAIAHVLARVVRRGVPQEVVGRVFLALRREALAAHVGADAGHDLELGVDQEEQAADDRDEEADDKGELSLHGPRGRGRHGWPRAGRSHVQPTCPREGRFHANAVAWSVTFSTAGTEARRRGGLSRRSRRPRSRPARSRRSGVRSRPWSSRDAPCRTSPHARRRSPATA
jgi:hypothetical protein